MKLAFLVQRYGPEVLGGAERYVRTMAMGLAAEGHEITVVTSCATSYEDWADVYEPGTTVEAGVTIVRLPVRAPRDNDRFMPLHLRAVDTTAVPLWPWAQDRWAQTMGPDLAGVQDVLPAVAAAADVTVVVGYHYAQSLHLMPIVASAGPTMLVPTAHPEGAFHVGWVRQMFEHADRVLCLAPEEAALVDRVHRCGERTTVVPCPVDDVARPTADVVATTLERFDLTDGGYAVVVGRVDPAKGSDDAIRFTGELRRGSVADFRLVIVGPGEANVVAPGVVTTGFVDEDTKTALVAASAAVIQPSYMESFSLALMEGWLLERPALVQRRSAVLAGHAARSGGGIAYGDYLDFEAAVTLLRRRPELGAQLGERGRRYARREFDWSVVAPAFLAAAAEAAAAGGQRLGRARSRA